MLNFQNVETVQKKILCVCGGIFWESMDILGKIDNLNLHYY